MTSILSLAAMFAMAHVGSATLGTGLTNLLAALGNGVQPIQSTSCCTCCTPVQLMQQQALPPVTTPAPAPVPQPAVAQPVQCCPCPPQQQAQGPKTIFIHLPPPPPTTRRPTSIFIHMPPPVVPLPPIPPFILTRPGAFGSSSASTPTPIGIPDVVTGDCGQIIVPLYNPPSKATSLGKK